MKCLLLTLPLTPCLRQHRQSHLSRLQTTPSCKSKLDPNAESFDPKKFDYNFINKQKTKRFYYSSGDGGGDDDVEEEEEGIDVVERGFEVFEEFVDSIWLLKVFESYGWFLPFILLSMLLSSGPKAFLMALALPLGQSTFSFAFQKMRSGRGEVGPKFKRKTKQTSRSQRSRPVRGEKAMNKEKMRPRRRPWVPGSKISAKKLKDNSLPYGGWDELDIEMERRRGSPTESDPRTSRSGAKEVKLSRSGRTGETPLLLRLLISAFPFLSSWIKLL